MTRPRYTVRVLIGIVIACAEARAADPTPDAVAHFEKEVRPLLVEHCQKCHGPKKAESGLRVDSRDALLKGGDSGPAVVPGKADKGTLLAAVRYDGEVKMPPAKQLTAAQVAVLTKWVSDGAAWPSEKAAGRTGGVTDADRRHWAFQPVADPPAPAARDTAWPLTDVDRFILARLEAAGVKPAAVADRNTLLRRVTFDLTGLPPTPDEIAAFLKDDKPGAFERVVERLLASKHYGERWGRHWLDVARYADTAGDGADYPVREAHKYRNWVIDSFNRDVPFNEFVRDQIAGDLIARAGPPERYAERVTATGFLAVGKRYGYNPGPDFQHLDFADVIESSGRALLGLSLGCARCHDHKYEPVTMADYYGLYGIFQSTKWSFPGGEEHQRPANLVPLIPPDEAARHDTAKAAELAKLDGEIAKLKADRAALDGKSKPPGADGKPVAPPAPPADLKERLAKIDAALTEATKARAAAAAFEPYPLAYGVSEGTPVNARVQLRGEPDRLGPEVPRRFLEILGSDKLPAGTTGSGRLELAQWITRPSNPLTARVFVNRVWQWHFGRGIVPIASDFGTRGEPPSHPELLDHLTTRFVKSGWSVKELHRLILRSRAYQLASAAAPAAVRADPENKLFGRFSRRPLDAESIRDAMLAVSGRLDRAAPAGHPFPDVSGWRFTIHAPFHAVYESDRRSVYLMVQRNRRHPFLALFDAADPNLSVGERLPTTTPTQALYLMNAPFVHTQAEAFARRLMAAPGNDAARVRLAFLSAHGVAPTDAAVADALEFLKAYRAKAVAAGVKPDAQPSAAWAALCRVLLTANAFLFVD